MRTTLGFLAALTLALAGCGGGGGGNVRPSDDMTPAPPPTTLSTDDAKRIVASSGLTAAQRVAAATPRFGSVTQSTNNARASTTFSGEPRLVVNIAQGGGSISLDTARHTLLYDLDMSSVTGRDYAQAVVLTHSASSLTLGLVATDWASDDLTDYLAGGYWIHATGDIYNGEVSVAEMGAFVDGPEIRGTPDLPALGTATYNGIAAGLYAARYGTDAQVPQGTHELGEFFGDLSLTADFGAKRISGRVDNINLSYVSETPDGRVYVSVDEPHDYAINLGAASFGSNGRFTGNDVTVTHPFIIARSSGSWGGKFSTVDDRAGSPRLTAGTFGATGTTSGGSTSSLVGAFYGATPEFE